MDAGIIQAFKIKYMKQLIWKFISYAEDDQPQAVNLREALHIVKTAWASVTDTTITNYTVSVPRLLLMQIIIKNEFCFLFTLLCINCPMSIETKM